MKLDWHKLLSTSRHGSSPRDPLPHRSDFETDYDRAIYSSSFRRLGKKTQVHPMEKNAQIHNRLTHSLEVASVARSLGRRLAHWLEDRGELPETIGEYDVAFSLMAASLAHDIGNPPFGHAGEYAIREWIESHQSEFFPEGFDDQQLIADVSLFEGNAQGFRLASRKDLGELAYLQFTYCSLGTMVKYPWQSTDLRAKKLKKYNFFSSEAGIAKTVFGEMGLINGDQFIRHPMSFLSEAADDICYRVIDIEDGVELKNLSDDEAHDLYIQLLGESKQDYHDAMKLPQLRAIVIGRLVDVFWKVFIDNYDSIMAGERRDDLKKGLSAQDTASLESVKETTTTKIFSAEKKILVEIGAYQVVGRILKAMSKATYALSEKQDLHKVPFIAKQCLSLAFSQEHLVANATKPFSWWVHQILDFISSMTDDRAIEVSNSINGFN